MVAHKNNFDFIRLFAATLVIIGHAYPLLDQSGVPTFYRSSVSTYAVKIFFSISGFLIVSSWVNDPNALRFIKKRALRIWPALIAVVCISAIVIGPMTTTLTLDEYFSHKNFGRYFENIKFRMNYSLPGVFNDNLYPDAVNGSLWSLPAELFLYILVLISGILTYRFSRSWFSFIWFASTFIALAMYTAVFAFGSNFADGQVFYATSIPALIEVAPYFMIGGCLYLLRQVISLNLTYSVVLLLLGHLLSESQLPVDPFLVVITTYSTIALGRASFPIINRFGKYGDISYGVYLWAFPIAQIFSWQFGNGVSLVIHILLTVVFSYISAFFSWHIIEKRALRYK